MDMRQKRNIPALSEAECTLLREKTVAVIGCGGLGGYLIEHLARLGVGTIRCVDGDVFEESNLNRQLLCTVSQLGTSKAQAAADRIRAIDPQIQVKAYPVFMDAANARELIKGCDAVLDALDSIAARKLLAQACKAEKIPYIYGAVSGWTAQAAICMPSEDFMEKLYPEEAVSENKSVLSFTPSLCASIQTALCVKLLTGRPVQTGVLCYADLLYDEYEQMKLQQMQVSL